MKRWITCIMAVVMTLTAGMPVSAETVHERFEEITVLNSVEYGHWSDRENFAWTFWDTGEEVVIGRGPVFSEVHPDITDPEYYVKEMVLYPGEEFGYDANGKPKACYDEESLTELREFVNSFDWIHSDELTRIQKVYERTANGQNGNYYENRHMGETASLALLVYGHGVCQQFAEEFVILAKAVGLEAVTYKPYAMHLGVLVTINGQCIAHDPTNAVSFFDNGSMFPCDYDTEYHRYES